MVSMERRRKQRRTAWEVIDVELGHIFVVETETDRDMAKAAIELVIHRAIVKEIKL